MYGLSIRGDEWRPVREFLPRVETSPAGNVVLPVGRELQPAGESGELRAGFWTQYAYMVLTQHEALALADELRAQVTAAQAAGRRGTEDLLRCNPDESAGVREELELARRPDMTHYGRDVLLAVLASGLPDWADATVSRPAMLAAARAELVSRYPCQDCGAPAGSECLPEFGCEARSRRNPSKVAEELAAGRDPRD